VNSGIGVWPAAPASKTAQQPSVNHPRRNFIKGTLESISRDAPGHGKGP
jgi:hypothetical protein